MKIETIKKIIGLFIIVILLLLTIDILLLQPIPSKNNTLIKGTFTGIKENIYKGDHSYRIYILENNQHFVIPADWSQCFYYDDFKNSVKPGEAIQITLINELFRSPEVASLKVSGSNYLSSDCINEEIHDEKIKIPLFSLGLAICIGLYLKYGKTKLKS